MNRVRGVLNLSGWAYVLSGAAFALLSFWPAGLSATVGAVLPGGGPVDAAAALMTGIAGGLTAGFGAAMIALARTPALDLAAAVRALSHGLLLWFVIDSGASIGHGAWRNAVANVLFLAIGLLPLGLLRRADATRLDGMAAAEAASAR